MISHAIVNIMIDTQNADSMKNENQISMKYQTMHAKMIPIVTNVNACINDDTGIGPSIASGNQICRPNWVDLLNPTIKIAKQNHITMTESDTKNIK